MKRLGRLVAGVLVAGAVLAAVTFAEAEPAGRYRVATAATGDVTQTVTVSGTVDHVNRADVAFGTDGTVAALSVSPGDTVTAGQELGSLDTTALAAAVDQADAELAAAEEALEQDEEDQERAAGASDELAAAQEEVKTAQTTASRALTTSNDAFAAQEEACADPGSAACAAAVTATRAAQDEVQRAQSALQAAIDALAGAVPAQPASAESVAGGQASVDEARARLVEAQQALDGAVLTTPIAGTVGSVTAAAGDRATAGAAVVTVIGAGAAEVTAVVPLAQLEHLAVGQEAAVTPVGTSASVPGTVTRVGTLPDESAETVAYPVTITVAEPPAAMAAGSAATAAVTVATARDVLTVPTSAVRGGTVTVLTDGQPAPVRVRTGAVGGVRTEIAEGLAAGDQVVLADLDAPVPAGDQPAGPRGPMGAGGPPMVIKGPGK